MKPKNDSRLIVLSPSSSTTISSKFGTLSTGQSSSSKSNSSIYSLEGQKEKISLKMARIKEGRMEDSVVSRKVSRLLNVLRIFSVNVLSNCILLSLV